MFIIHKIFLILGLIIFLTGCNKQEITVPKQSIIKKTTIIKKQKTIYKYCNKHTKTMNHASAYIKNEFDKGYFLQKDSIGAKAQVFLIENNSPSIFAKNINAAQKSYNLHYNLAKKNGCNIKKFKEHPISKVKKTIRILEK